MSVDISVWKMGFRLDRRRSLTHRFSSTFRWPQLSSQALLRLATPSRYKDANYPRGFRILRPPCSQPASTDSHDMLRTARLLGVGFIKDHYSNHYSSAYVRVSECGLQVADLLARQVGIRTSVVR